MSHDTYAIITTREIGQLAALKPAATTVLVYTTLLSYAQGKTTCFPKVETIRERLQNAYSISAIMKALKWLQDHDFIKRGKKRSKDRFQLLKRVVRQVAEKTMNNLSNVTHSTSPMLHDNKKKEKTSFFKKGTDKTRSFFSKVFNVRDNREKEADNEQVCKAEKPYGAWAIQNPDMNVKTINKEDLSLIVQCLKSEEAQDKEWREIMSWSPINKKAFQEILAL